MRVGLITGAVAAMLVVAAPAHAAKGTYAGEVTNTTGKIALDVKIKRGHVVKITYLRGKGIPSNCEVSGQIPAVNFDLPATLVVNQQTAKFNGTYVQPTYGNESSIKGTFFGRKVEGKVRVNYHYAAEGEYPEENCDTGRLRFEASLDNPDETVTSRPNWR